MLSSLLGTAEDKVSLSNSVAELHGRFSHQPSRVGRAMAGKKDDWTANVNDSHVRSLYHA